jgi:hypothetical protein
VGTSRDFYALEKAKSRFLINCQSTYVKWKISPELVLFADSILKKIQIQKFKSLCDLKTNICLTRSDII